MDETKKRATKWTDAKVAAMKLPVELKEQRVLVAPGLYLHLRRKADASTSKHWQYRAQVEGVRRWLALGAYPAVRPPRSWWCTRRGTRQPRRARPTIR